MQSIIMTELIPVKFCTWTPVGDVVIYLKQQENRFRGLGEVRIQKTLKKPNTSEKCDLSLVTIFT